MLFQNVNVILSNKVELMIKHKMSFFANAPMVTIEEAGTTVGAMF